MSRPASAFPVTPSRLQSVSWPAIIASGACLVGGPLPAQTNLYWDTGTGGGLQGGAGIWSTSATNWNDSAGTAGANAAWSGTNNSANFSGTSGAVTVDTSITLSRLNASAGYSFSGTGGLDFGANAGVIDTSANISTFGIGLAGTNGITKGGSGTFTFTGTGTYTGTLRVSGGTFTLGNTTATTNRLSPTSSLAIGSSSAAGTFSMAAATGGTSSQTFANLGAGAGLNVLQSSGAGTSNIANITFNGTYSRSNTGVISFANATGFNVTANFSNNNDGTHIIDGILVGVNRSNNTFVANNNTANGAPTGTNNVWSSGTHTVATSSNGTAYTGTTASLRLSGSRTVTVGAGAVINTGMISNNGGAATGTITGGTLTSGNGRDLILLGGDSAYRIELASQIVNNGSTPVGLLIANATGTTGNLISGSNSYTGDTTLAASFTIAGHDNAFGTGKIVFAGGALGASIGSNRVLSNDISIVAATANLNGLNQSASAPFGGAGTTYDLTLGGDISGSGNLSLNNNLGANKVTLSGDNSAHTGTVVVNAANTILALGSDNAIGTGVNMAQPGTVTSSDATARSFTVTNYPAAGGIFGAAGTGDLNVTMPTLGASAYTVNVGNALTTFVNPTMGTGTGAAITKTGAGTLAVTGDLGIYGGAAGAGLTINSGSFQIGTGGTTGGLTITGTVANVNGNGNLAFNRSNDYTFGAAITGNVAVQQKGGGTTTLTATNTYTGATDVNSGTLTIDTTGSIANSTAVSVAAGARLVYHSSTALNVAPTLHGSGSSNRAVLGGTGTINAALTLDNPGDTLAPGTSPGILPFTADQAWTSFSFDWELNDFAATTAPGANFDQLGITGSLSLAGAANSFTLNVLSLTGLNASGEVPNFSEIDRSWTILTTTTGISGFNAAHWSINASGFTNPETGTFSLAQNGANLVLSYTPVPEPAAALPGALGLLALLRRRRSPAAG